MTTLAPSEVLGAMITPSFRGDLERCRLLVESVERFLPGCPHYVAVVKADLKLFKTLAHKNLHLLVVEDILGSSVYQLPFYRKIWHHRKQGFVRGWIVQQLTKLALGTLLHEENLFFLDSDTFWIRSPKPDFFLRDGKLRLFRVERHDVRSPLFPKWHQTASDLLGQEMGTSMPNYIGNPVTWRKSCLRELHAIIEKKHEMPWIEAILKHQNLAEYILYGRFVSALEPEASGHFYDDRSICKEWWHDRPMSTAELESFARDLHPDQSMVMISAKAKMHPALYRKSFAF